MQATEQMTQFLLKKWQEKKYKKKGNLQIKRDIREKCF